MNMPTGEGDCMFCSEMQQDGESSRKTESEPCTPFISHQQMTAAMHRMQTGNCLRTVGDLAIFSTASSP